MMLLSRQLIELEQNSFYENDPCKKLTGVGIGFKFVPILDFLQNRVALFALLCIILAR